MSSQISVPAILSGKFFEVLKYELRLDYQLGLELYFMNAKKFASLRLGTSRFWLRRRKRPSLAPEGRTGSPGCRDTRTGEERNGGRCHRHAGRVCPVGVHPERVWQQVGEQQGAKVDMKLAEEMYRSQ